jgi:hypothetical protein
MNKQWLLSRRALLGGLAASGAYALMPRGFHEVARAQAAPTRLILVHVPEGMWSGAPKPAVGGTNLGPIFEAVQDWQSKILVVDNMNMASRDNGPGGDGHHRSVPHMFTCTEMLDGSKAGGISIDQKIANAIGGESPFRSVHLANRPVWRDTNYTSLWSGPGSVVLPQENPWREFDRLFAGVTPGTPMPTEPGYSLKKSVLDHSLAETAALRSRLTSTDQMLLDSYQDSLRDVERRLGTITPPSSGGCTLPEPGSEANLSAEANYEAIGKLEMDIIVHAMQCNLTRVATLHFGNSNDQCSYSWLGVNTLGHDMAHNNNNADPSGSKKLTTYRWYSTMLDHLLTKLDSVPEGDGTMLDSTVVVWASEFSDSNGHNSNKLMWLLCGNVNGFFRSGRVVDAAGKSLNDFHTSLGNAFGLSDSTFGNPAYCDGPLAILR